MNAIVSKFSNNPQLDESWAKQKSSGRDFFEEVARKLKDNERKRGLRLAKHSQDILDIIWLFEELRLSPKENFKFCLFSSISFYIVQLGI